MNKVPQEEGGSILCTTGTDPSDEASSKTARKRPCTHTITTSLRQAQPLRLGQTHLPAAHAKSTFSVSS